MSVFLSAVRAIVSSLSPPSGRQWNCMDCVHGCPLLTVTLTTVSINSVTHTAIKSNVTASYCREEVSVFTEADTMNYEPRLKMVATVPRPVERPLDYKVRSRVGLLCARCGRSSRTTALFIFIERTVSCDRSSLFFCQFPTNERYGSPEGSNDSKVTVNSCSSLLCS